jgi:hypothetical protein
MQPIQSFFTEMIVNHQQTTTKTKSNERTNERTGLCEAELAVVGLLAKFVVQFELLSILTFSL